MNGLWVQLMVSVTPIRQLCVGACVYACDRTKHKILLRGYISIATQSVVIFYSKTCEVDTEALPHSPW